MRKTGIDERSLTDAFHAQEVLAGLQTGRDGDVDVSVVEEEEVGAPLVRLRVEALLEDLHPGSDQSLLGQVRDVYN